MSFLFSKSLIFHSLLLLSLPPQSKRATLVQHSQRGAKVCACPYLGHLLQALLSAPLQVFSERPHHFLLQRNRGTTLNTDT